MNQVDLLTFTGKLFALLQNALQASLEILFRWLREASSLADNSNRVQISTNLLPILFLHHAGTDRIQQLRQWQLSSHLELRVSYCVSFIIFSSHLSVVDFNEVGDHWVVQRDSFVFQDAIDVFVYEAVVDEWLSVSGSKVMNRTFKIGFSSLTYLCVLLFLLIPTQNVGK